MPGARQDKVVLVTSGSSGIGEACVRRIARGGARVAVVDIDRSGAERVAAELSDSGVEAQAVEANVADEASVAEMVRAVMDRFGRLDGAVNNAGVAGDHFALADYPFESWRRLMSVNLDGVFLRLREEVRAMRGNGVGSIVNMASVLAAAGYPEEVACVSSKHALVGLTPCGGARPRRRRDPSQRRRPRVHPHRDGQEDDDAGSDRRGRTHARARAMGEAG